MTERTQLKRYAKRAEYDREVVHAILDEVCCIPAVHSQVLLHSIRACISPCHKLPARGVMWMLHWRPDGSCDCTQAFVCHIGFTSEDGQPWVIPTGYARDGETLYFHGSVGSRMLRALEAGRREALHDTCTCTSRD